MIFKRIAQLSFAACLAVFAGTGSGTFEGFTQPFPVQGAALFGGNLYLATAGGVRLVTSSGEGSLYTSEDGLGFSDVASVVAANGALYAISNRGVVARLASGASKFTELNRSYESSGSVAVDDLVTAHEGVLVVGFEDKLAFYDLASDAFIISLSAIGDTKLLEAPPTALLVRGDSLLVAAGGNVYYREMAWDSLAYDRLISNPDSWTLLKETSGVGSMAFDASGKLQTRSLSGTFAWLDGKKFALAEDTSALVIAGKEVTSGDLFSDGTSRVKWLFQDGSKYFFAGSNFVGYGTASSVSDLSAWSSYTLGPVYEATALPNGGIIASSIYSTLAFTSGSDVSTPVSIPNTDTWTNEENYAHLIKALAVLPSGETHYAIWGLGSTIFTGYDASSVLIQAFASSGTCMENYLTNYLVIHSAIAAPDSVGFLADFWGEDAYGLVYFDLYGDVYCATGIGTEGQAGALVARVAESGSWEVFVAYRGNASSLNTTGGIDYFLVTPPSRSGSLSVEGKSTIATPENAYPIDMAFDSEDRLWAVTYSTLGFWESGDSLREPNRMAPFSANAFSSLAVDPQDAIWVGTTGDGVYRLAKAKSSVDTLVATHFRMRDGLLSENVYDLALDSVNGSLWFAQDLGLSKLTRDDLRSASGYMTSSADSSVKVYPNPFRPKIHSELVFDYVSEDARISIFNAGGKLVKSLSGDELLGGRAEWDGKDGSGRLVAPGVYHYLVKRGSKTKKGKLLIIH